MIVPDYQTHRDQRKSSEGKAFGGFYIHPGGAAVPRYSRPRDLLAEWITPTDAVAYPDTQGILLPHRLPRALDRDLQARYGDRMHVHETNGLGFGHRFALTLHQPRTPDLDEVFGIMPGAKTVLIDVAFEFIQRSANDAEHDGDLLWHFMVQKWRAAHRRRDHVPEFAARHGAEDRHERRSHRAYSDRPSKATGQHATRFELTYFTVRSASRIDRLDDPFDLLCHEMALKHVDQRRIDRLDPPLDNRTLARILGAGADKSNLDCYGAQDLHDDIRAVRPALVTVASWRDLVGSVRWFLPEEWD